MIKSKRPTLRDVAREAEVSYQTVSRVINNSEHVSTDTRTRVQAVIKRLGFKPNRAAQILQTERSHTIEVVIFNSGFNQFLYEMARSAQHLGYHFVISAITPHEFEKTLESAASRFVDGLILVPETVMSHDYESLMSLTDGTPIVQVGAKLGASIPSIIYNQYEGGRLAAQHLIDLGHRQIAEISGPLDNHDGCDRHTAWLETLKENGITPGPTAEGDFSIDSGYRAMRKLLATGQPFTAVFVGNDSMCIGAHTALREHGLRVPEDVSLVGFDDVPEAAHFVPGLTTIRQDFSLLGRLAIEYITSLIDFKDTPIHQRVLQPSLIIRESTRRL